MNKFNFLSLRNMFVITLELKSGLTFDSANSLSLHSKEMKIKSEPSRSRCWILILFWKPSFKFQKCLYTCKAAAVAQSSLVGCKIFRPSWDVKLVLLGPRHPFFFRSFSFSSTLEHLSVLFRFLCQNNREPAFVCKCDTHYPLGQWNVSVDSSKTLDRDGHSWNWIFHHMCILTCTCRQHSCTKL